MPEKEFEQALLNVKNKAPLDFTKLKIYIAKFEEAEKKSRGALISPARKLHQYVDLIEEAFSDDEKDLIVGKFENLFNDGSVITEFLDAYGYEHIDDPEIKDLTKFYNEIQVLGMQYQANKEDRFYSLNAAQRGVLNEKEMKVFYQMAQFYADIEHDQLKVNTLVSDFQKCGKDVAELEKQLNETTNKINEFKTVDQDIKDIASKLSNFEGLQEANSDIAFYENNIKFFDPSQNETLARADKSVADLTEMEVKLNAEIEAHTKYINENQAADIEYIKNVDILSTLFEGKALKDKGITVEALDKKYSALNDAFGDLSLLGTQLEKTKFKDALSQPSFKERYEADKKIIIDNFSDNPKLTNEMKDIFHTVETSGNMYSLDILLEQNMRAFNNNLNNLKADKESIQKYDRVLKAVNDGKELHDGVEHSKEQIDACKKGITKCQHTIAQIKNNNLELRKPFFDHCEMDKDDIIEMSGISNAEFTLELKDNLERVTEDKDKIINSEEYKDLEKQLSDKIKLRETYDIKDLEESSYLQKVELNHQKKKYDMLDKHVKTLNSFGPQVDEITKMRDALHADMKEAERPNRFALLEKSLTDIKAKFDKIPKGSKNTPEFDAVYNGIDIALDAVKKGDLGLVKLSLEGLDKKTDTYAKEKAKQTRLFPSTLRKLRLQTNEELHNICTNKDLIGASVHEKKAELDHFLKTYEPGNSQKVGADLMSLAQRYYKENAKDYIQKVDFEKDAKDFKKQLEESPIVPAMKM